MMLPVHALVGMVLALPVVFGAPAFASAALWGGLAGGIFPDLDMVFVHRKTLHYPTYYSALAVAGIALAVVVPTAATIAAMFFFVSAAVHSVMDAFGGGLSLRPWEPTSDRAVYDHYRRTWYSPRRWIRYDGAPEGLLLTAVLAIALLAVLDEPFRRIILAAVAVGVVYTAVRRRLPTLGRQFVQRVLEPVLPNRLLRFLPAHLLSDQDT